jgi:hypothetical protein
MGKPCCYLINIGEQVAECEPDLHQSCAHGRTIHRTHDLIRRDMVRHVTNSGQDGQICIGQIRGQPFCMDLQSDRRIGRPMDQLCRGCDAAIVLRLPLDVFKELGTLARIRP